MSTSIVVLAIPLGASTTLLMCATATLAIGILAAGLSSARMSRTA